MTKRLFIKSLIFLLSIILSWFNLPIYSHVLAEELNNSVVYSENNLFHVDISQANKGLLFIFLDDEISFGNLNYYTGFNSMIYLPIYPHDKIIVPIQHINFNNHYIELFKLSITEEGNQSVFLDKIIIPNNLLNISDALNPYLISNSIVNYREGDSIQNYLESITNLYLSESEIAFNISDFIRKNIKYNESENFKSKLSAEDILINKSGNCREISLLTASLFREAGIPSQHIIGYYNLNGQMVSHSWNRIYINNEWVDIDLTNYELFIPPCFLDKYIETWIF